MKNYYDEAKIKSLGSIFVDKQYYGNDFNNNNLDSGKEAISINKRSSNRKSKILQVCQSYIHQRTLTCRLAFIFVEVHQVLCL